MRLAWNYLRLNGELCLPLGCDRKDMGDTLCAAHRYYGAYLSAFAAASHGRASLS